MSARPAYPMTMFNLLRAVYWYDEALQTSLQQTGWPQVTRTQSMLFANIALGETRPSRLAEKMGMTRQSMSELIARLVERELLVTTPDPDDRRAIKVSFHPRSGPLRHAAEAVLFAIRQYLDQHVGHAEMAAFDAVLAADWGDAPLVPAPDPGTTRPRKTPS